MPDARTVCTFWLDGLFCGVEVGRVQEVLRPQEMTRVPLAPPAVAGLINLRGLIVTAIDLRRRLGMADRPADRPPMNVVVRAGQDVMSLLVDEVGDVVEADAGLFEPPPEPLQGPARELLRGVYRLPDRLLLLIDPDKVVHLTPTDPTEQ